MNLRRIAGWLVVVGCLVSQIAVAQTSTRKAAARKSRGASHPKKPAPPLRTKVAEGRYELRSQSATSLRTWEEPWTLYKTKTGFEVTELWKATREDASAPVEIDVLLVLAPGMAPTEARIGSDLSSAQLVCSMAMTEFRCTADGKKNSLPMTGPYNFFLPSPWFLSSIARRAPKKPDQPVKVKLVQMTGMEDSGPKLISFDAEVAYVGEDVVEIGSARHPASIYEIHGPAGPRIEVWVSAEGVVLQMQDASKPEQRMELVLFSKSVAF